MNPNPTHEIQVCEICGHRPTVCRCAQVLLGHPTDYAVKLRQVRGRAIVKRRELTRKGVAEAIEILLTAIERDGIDVVRFKLDGDGDPFAEATDAADLRVLRRALLGENHGIRHATRPERLVHS